MNQNIHWYPGHMAKAVNLIGDKSKLIDIIIEIRDARIPYSSRNPIIDDIVHNKPKIIILSKIDLADPKMTKKWIQYYEVRGYHVIESNLLNFHELKKIVDQARLELHEQYERDKKRGLKERPMRGLIVGIPNVGKSTLINKIAKRPATKTGDKAGITRALQWIKVDKDFELLDSPGILWPRLDEKTVAINLALSGAIKEEILPKEDLCFYAMRFLNTYYQTQFYERYDIEQMDNDNIDSIIKVLEHIGRKRGCLVKGNEVDFEKVYDLILRELKKGDIGRVTLDHEFTE